MTQDIGPAAPSADTAGTSPTVVSTPLADRLRDRVQFEGRVDNGGPLAAALLAVLDHHSIAEYSTRVLYCAGCTNDMGDTWPCQTVEAIAEALGVEL